MATRGKCLITMIFVRPSTNMQRAHLIHNRLTKIQNLFIECMDTLLAFFWTMFFFEGISHFKHQFTLPFLANKKRFDEFTNVSKKISTNGPYIGLFSRIGSYLSFSSHIYSAIK